MTDEKMADEYASKYGDDNTIKFMDGCVNLWPIRRCSFLDGLKAGRQQQSGIGWIDTAHIEIKLHDAVESIKKQLDVMLQELLGGNNKEVEK